MQYWHDDFIMFWNENIFNWWNPRLDRTLPTCRKRYIRLKLSKFSKLMCLISDFSKYVANFRFFSAAGEFFLKNDRNQWFLYRNNIFMTLFYTYMLIKFHQNLGKLSFSMTFIGFYQTLIEISSTNNQKRSKMIKKIGNGIP